MRRQEPITIELGRADYRVDGKRRPACNFDRAAIMRRAHVLKSERRQKLAERVYAAEARVVAGKPWHPRTFQQVLKATPVDFGAALSAAWNEAKTSHNKRARKGRKASASSALAVIGEQWRSRDLGGLLASVTAIAVALGRTIKAAGAAIDARFLASRPAGLSLPVNAPRQIQ